MEHLSTKTWIGTWLFVVGLIGLLGAIPIGIRLWKRKMAEVDRVAQNASLPFILQLVNRAIDFGFAFVLYRFIQSTTIQGAFDFAALIVVAYLGTIAEWGLGVLQARDIARDPAHSAAIFERTLKLRTRLASLAIPAVGMVIVAFWLLKRLGLIEHALDQQTITLLGILVLTLQPAALSSAVSALFQGHERLEIPAVINLATNSLSALLRTVALMTGFGIVGVATGSLIGTLVGAGLFLIALRRFQPTTRLRSNAKPEWSLLREGWPLLLNNLLITVFFRFDMTLILAFQGESAVATYNVGYKYIGLTQIIPPVVVGALFPMLVRRAHDDRQGMQRAYHGTLRILVMLALPLAVGFMLLATPLVTILGEEKYLPGAAIALAVTIWYLPLSYINGLLQYVVIALGKQQIITKAFGITAAFNIILNVMLIPRYGYLAAAAVTVASEAVLFLPLQRILKDEGVEVAIWSLAMRPALAAVAMGIAIWGALQIHWLVAVLIAPVVYGLGLWAVGGINSDDRRLLARSVGRGKPRPDHEPTS